MIEDLLIKPSPGYDEVLVYITFSNLDMAPEDYIFSLERGETSEGPWYYISGNVVLDYMEDKTVDRTIFRDGVSTFYRVIIRDSNGAKQSEFVKELLLEKADRFALTIETNFKRYLDAQDLNDFQLMRRSKTSEHCSCYNDVREESEDPNCPICGGTGRSLGYLKGPLIKVSIINPITQDALVKEMFGEITLNISAARAWTTGKVRLSTEDILIDTFSNDIFEIETVAYSKRKNYIVRQAVTMKKLEIGDPLYTYMKGVM